MESVFATALLIGSTPRCWPGDHLVGMCGDYPPAVCESPLIEVRGFPQVSANQGVTCVYPPRTFAAVRGCRA
jgi:hypothetical protein